MSGGLDWPTDRPHPTLKSNHTHAPIHIHPPPPCCCCRQARRSGWRGRSSRASPTSWTTRWTSTPPRAPRVCGCERTKCVGWAGLEGVGSWEGAWGAWRGTRDCRRTHITRAANAARPSCLCNPHLHPPTPHHAARQKQAPPPPPPPSRPTTACSTSSAAGAATPPTPWRGTWWGPTAGVSSARCAGTRGSRRRTACRCSRRGTSSRCVCGLGLWWCVVVCLFVGGWV